MFFDQEKIIPLEKEKRSHLSTDEAAAHIGLKPQTLRTWACYKSGPIAPIKVSTRLRWSVNELRDLLEITLTSTRP